MTFFASSSSDSGFLSFSFLSHSGIEKDEESLRVKDEREIPCFNPEKEEAFHTRHTSKKAFMVAMTTAFSYRDTDTSGVWSGKEREGPL